MSSRLRSQPQHYYNIAGKRHYDLVHTSFVRRDVGLPLLSGLSIEEISAHQLFHSTSVQHSIDHLIEIAEVGRAKP
jgi:hypothetical protein